MLNSLDTDQARRSVWPDLGPKCLQSLSVDGTSRLRKYFRNIITVLNSLDPDQARLSVGPDHGPNCLQRLSADNTSRQSYHLNCNKNPNLTNWPKEPLLNRVCFAIQWGTTT